MGTHHLINIMIFKNMKNFRLRTNILQPIYRERGPVKSRLKYLRLDKNERVSNFEKKLFKNIVKKFKSEYLTAYPELEKIYSLIARRNNISKNNLVITAGSDGAIRMCFDLFTKNNDQIMCLSPTFAMVDIYSRTHKLKQVKIKYDTNLVLDLKSILNNITKNIALIILANPNSPTGTLINKKNLTAIIEKSQSKKVPILIDEAYFGFTKFTALPLIKKYKNLIIARTFSKAYGLAGCRAGYLATNKELAKKFFSFKPMYEINSLASVIIEEFIKKKIDKKYSRENLEGKKSLIEFFQKKKLRYIDTHANFIHVDFREKKNKLLKTFIKKKILVKGGIAIKGLENFVRLTTGPKNEMNKIINILKSFF